MKRILLPFFFLVFATLPAAALEAPLRVADFAPGVEPDPIAPEYIQAAGGRLFFRGRDAAHGREPWISDGTAAGTRRLADLCPGRCDGSFSFFVELGGRAFFTSGGRLLMASEEGVTTAAELGGYISSLVVLPPFLYLMANDGAGGTRPYRSDGTTQGTRPAPEICGELVCHGDVSPHAAAGRLHYLHGGELYGLGPGGERQRLAALTRFYPSAVLGDTLFFQGCTPEGCRLWATGGDAASTRILASLGGGVVAWRGRVYFGNEAGGMSSTDGSAAGTTAEPAFPAGARPLVASPLALFYRVETGVTSQLLGAVEAGGAHHNLLAFPGGGGIAGRLDNRFFFSFSGEGSTWLAVSGGTTASTEIVAETGSSTIVGAALNGHFYFGSDEPHDSIFNPTLWRTDGTAAGTVEVVPLRLGGVSSRPRSFSLGQSLVVVTDGPDGKLYRVNPATLAVELVDDRPTSAIAAGRDIFFAAAGQFPDRTLVALRESGPSIDLPAAAGDGAALDEAGRLYFSGGGPGQQLWRSDGTPEGTAELFDLRPGWTACTGSHHCVEDLPKDITPSGGNVFFVAEVENGDAALWVWPAAGGAPRRLDPPGGFGNALVAAGGGVLFFNGGGGPNAAAGMIWRTDGTDAGTRPLFSLPLGLEVTQMKLVGQRLFLTAYLPGSYDLWLWAGDLGAAGILPLAPLAKESGGLAAAGDHLYFGAASGGGGRSSLAFADGTAAGTRLLRFGAEDQGTGSRGIFALADQRVVFAAAGDESGNELWISDGTSAGTYRLTDLAPGADSSSPSDFAQVGGRLFFQADDGNSGRELWALDLPPAGPICPDDRLCLHGGRYEVFATVSVPGPEPLGGRRAVATGESGVFTFFSETNWEVTARLDAPDSAGVCAFTAAVASHLPTELTIIDRAGLAETRRFSLRGYGDAPATVFALLPECGADWAGDGYRPALPPAPPTLRCADESDALCLLGGRFRVRAFWRDGNSAGRAWPQIGSSQESGVFALPSPLGGELLVKVLDGCSFNGHRWVFAAGSAPDAGFTLEITDLATGSVKTYRQEVGAPAIPFQDAAAFACY